MRDIYRLAAGAVTLIAVAAQGFLVLHDKTGTALASASLHFFSFFTIQTNLLVAAAFLVPVVWRNSAVGRFLSRASVRTAIAGYIIIVGVVFYFLLSHLEPPGGPELFFERVLHYVTPPLFVLDWLLFVPRGEVGWRVGLLSLGFPAGYAAYTLLHGAASGWYPYPFLDVSELGYRDALANMAGLVLAFLALELALVAADRLLLRFPRVRVT
jgi:hypothetical protein